MEPLIKAGFDSIIVRKGHHRHVEDTMQHQDMKRMGKTRNWTGMVTKIGVPTRTLIRVGRKPSIRSWLGRPRD